VLVWLYHSLPLEYELIFTAKWTKEAEDEETQILLPDGWSLETLVRRF
jgi:hypothetical protein